MSLRSNILAAFALCMALPVATGMGALWLGTEDTLRQRAGDSLQAEARLVMAAVEQQMATTLTHLQAWSTMPMMQEVLIDDDAGELARTLEDLAKRYPEFASLTITNAQGQVVASTEKAFRKASLSTVEGIQAAVSGRTTQSGFTRLRDGAAEAIRFTVPLFAAYDRQTAIGTLTGIIDFRNIVDRAARHAPLNQERRAFAIARADTGKLVFANRSADAVGSAIGAVNTTGAPSATDVVLAGEPSLAVFARSAGRILQRDPGLVTFAIEPLADIQATADHVWNIFTVLAGLAGLAAMAMAWRWAEPLVALSGQIVRIGRGHTNTQVTALPPQSAFAPMANALERLRVASAERDTMRARQVELQDLCDRTQAVVIEREKQLQDMGHVLQSRLADFVDLVDMINRENLAAASARRLSPHMQDLNRTACELLDAVRQAIEAADASAERTRELPAHSETPALQRLSA